MKKQKFLTTFLFIAVIFFTLSSSAFGTTVWGSTPSGNVGEYYYELFISAIEQKIFNQGLSKLLIETLIF